MAQWVVDSEKPGPWHGEVCQGFGEALGGVPRWVLDRTSSMAIAALFPVVLLNRDGQPVKDPSLWVVHNLPVRLCTGRP